MNDLQRIILLVSLGTIAFLLCLPACTHAQPNGLFQFDYEDDFDPSFEGDYANHPVRLSRQQILRKLSELAMSRSGKGKGYTLPRKRQVGAIGLRFFPLDRLTLDEQLRSDLDRIARATKNRQDFDNAGKRR